ncbi:MAG: hypothetical protein N2712_07075 [Brevinematales bacterium]|nr:hypothetical protein [Brevinematales bacterium]
MKYTLYQVAKYTFVFFVLFIFFIYLSKTDRLPRFIPDDVRNTLIDFSDYLLSYDTFSVVFSVFQSFFDFLADDGYSYKYSLLPKAIVDRLSSEFDAINNSINLFLNNPLFETWIIPNTFPQGILKETFRNYFSEDFYTGFSIYSSKFIQIFSLGVPESDDVKQFLVSFDGFSFHKDYILKYRKLSRDLDLIDGYFVLYIDKKKFFDYVLGDSKREFEMVYFYYGGNIVYLSRDVSIDYVLRNIDSQKIELFGNIFAQRTFKYDGMIIGFVIPNPSWTRFLYVGFKILVFLAFLFILFRINISIRDKLKRERDIRYRMIKDLKKAVSSLSKPSDMAISNLLVKATEENLKYFEALVENDKKTESISKKKTSLLGR